MSSFSKPIRPNAKKRDRFDNRICFSVSIKSQVRLWQKLYNYFAHYDKIEKEIKEGKMAFKKITTHHFVKSEDLNHHRTLFAGRNAEWFVESGLMSAARHLPVENIVCVKIHGMNFSRPIHLGDTVRYVSKVVSSGRTSVVSHIEVSVENAEVLEGFITFVNVDEAGRPLPHGLNIQPDNEEEAALAARAKALPR